MKIDAATKAMPRQRDAVPGTKPAARSLTFQSTWTAFWAAFLIRLSQIAMRHTPRFLVTTYADHRSFGWEMGRIAHALVTGRGYADPFFGHTGPTAWVAPLYPLLLAGVFKIFGVYTVRAAWVILTLNCLFFALMTRTIYEIAARCTNRRVAFWSAWIWVFYPAMMVFIVWETILSGWLFSWILVLSLRMRRVGESDADTDGTTAQSDPRTLWRWLLFGLLWALLALSNPSLLLFLPACGLWVLGWPGRTAKTQTDVAKKTMGRQVRFAAASALLFLLCVAPWTARNWIAFHRFVPMRTNFGAEFYLGNGPGGHGFSMMKEHPFQSPEQFLLYQQMGEVRYSQMRGRMARAYIASDPRHFVWNTVRRTYYFWLGGRVPWYGPWYAKLHQLEHWMRYPIASIAGLLGLALALKRRVPGARLFAWAFVLIPLVYYFVSVDKRFRFPLEPLIAVLAVYLIQSIVQGLSAHRKPIAQTVKA